MVAALATAGVLAAHWLARQHAPEPRRLIYIDQEGPPFRAIYASFEHKLASLANATDPPLALEYFVLGDGGPAVRARLAERLEDRPAVVVTTSFGATRMVRELSPSTPIVFGSNADPVKAGLVADLNRPGGNSTGFTSALPSFGKRIELLVEAVPTAKRVGILVDAADDREWFTDRDAVAARLGVELRFVGAAGGRDPAAVRSAILEHGRDIDAWYVPYFGAAFFNQDTVIEALEAARKPAIFERARFVDMGGLMAYQHTVEEPGERLAESTAQILHGVPPGEIPVVRPRRFELALNLATARRLGLELPKPLIKSATRVVTE